MIAILASLLLNALGTRDLLYQLPVTGGLIGTLDFLSALTIPLILIIVGYGVKIDRDGLGEALIVVVIRLGLMIPLVFFLNAFLIRNLLGLGKLFETALFTLLVMPPPFIIPLYTDKNLDQKEKNYINNVLTVNTVISVGIFLVYFVLNPLL